MFREENFEFIQERALFKENIFLFPTDITVDKMNTFVFQIKGETTST
jgi:hypothetical protein